MTSSPYSSDYDVSAARKKPLDELRALLSGVSTGVAGQLSSMDALKQKLAEDEASRQAKADELGLERDRLAFMREREDRIAAGGGAKKPPSAKKTNPDAEDGPAPPFPADPSTQEPSIPDAHAYIAPPGLETQSNEPKTQKAVAALRQKLKNKGMLYADESEAVDNPQEEAGEPSIPGATVTFHSEMTPEQTNRNAKARGGKAADPLDQQMKADRAKILHDKATRKPGAKSEVQKAKEDKAIADAEIAKAKAKALAGGGAGKPPKAMTASDINQLITQPRHAIQSAKDLLTEADSAGIFNEVKLPPSMRSTKRRKFESDVTKVIQNVARHYEGGKLTDDDFRRYSDTLLNKADSPESFKVVLGSIIKDLEDEQAQRERDLGTSYVVPKSGGGNPASGFTSESDGW